MGTEITWKYDGSAIARTSTLLAVWTVEDWSVGDFIAKPDYKIAQLIDSAIPLGDPHPVVMRPWSITIKADCSGMAGAVTERNLIAAWHELAEVFNPSSGVKKLEASYKDVAAAAVSKHLLVDIDTVPEFRSYSNNAGGLTKPGAYLGGAAGYVIYKFGGQTAFPYWQSAALLTTDTAPATAEVNVAASPDTVTINNPGARWCGLKIEYGSASGSVTQFTLSNGANGDLLTLNNAGGFSNTDEADWFASDPRYATYTDASTLPAGAGDKIRLQPGNNTLTCTRTAGTGTGTLTLSYPNLSMTLGDQI